MQYLTIKLNRNLSISIFIIAILLCSCEDEENTLGVGFIDSTTRIFQVDTFYVELSTIIVDSVNTSGTEVALVGYFEDGELGKIKAQCFTQLNKPAVKVDDHIDIDENEKKGLKDEIDIQNDDKYDSITIILPYNNYYYGDTNEVLDIGIHFVDEDMARYDGETYYNTSGLDISPEQIGSVQVAPKPYKDSILEIRIGDAIGKDIFEKLKNGDDEIQSLENFQDYIYGIAITPENSNSSSIIGFNQSGLALTLYTSRPTEHEEDDQIIYEMESVGYQFNQIQSDRSGTALEDISSQDEFLISTQAGNRSYIQGGLGIITKIRFPYLNSILFNTGDIILSAELILKPDEESYESEFPSSLYLFSSNEYHEFNAFNEDLFVASSLFSYDEKYHEDTYYSFDITYYFEELISAGYIDNDLCLMASVNSSEFRSTLKRLVLSSERDSDTRPILRITYLEN